MPFRDFSPEKLSGRIPPARRYLWVVDLVPPNSQASPDTLTMQARTVSIPNMTEEEIEIPYMNSRFYIAGRRNWDTIDASFMDNEDGDIYGIFYNWKNRIYDVEGFGHGGVPKEYKTRMDITRLTVKGQAIDEFVMIGVWPVNLQNLDLDYDNDEVTLVSVTFRFDFWVRNPQRAKIVLPGLPAPGQLDIPGITTQI